MVAGATLIEALYDAAREDPHNPMVSSASVHYIFCVSVRLIGLTFRRPHLSDSGGFLSQAWISRQAPTSNACSGRNYWWMGRNTLVSANIDRMSALLLSVHLCQCPREPSRTRHLFQKLPFVNVLHSGLHPLMIIVLLPMRGFLLPPSGLPRRL